MPLPAGIVQLAVELDPTSPALDYDSDLDPGLTIKAGNALFPDIEHTEGIEKKQENFAEEVMQQVSGS